VIASALGIFAAGFALIYFTFRFAASAISKGSGNFKTFIAIGIAEIIFISLISTIGACAAIKLRKLLVIIYILILALLIVLCITIFGLLIRGKQRYQIDISNVCNTTSNKQD